MAAAATERCRVCPKTAAQVWSVCGRIVLVQDPVAIPPFEHNGDVSLENQLTNQLTPWSTVLLEKLNGSQLVKKFSTFYGNRRFITAFTSARHLSLSWARSIKSMSSHPTSWRVILILSSHILLGLPSNLLASGLPSKTLYTSVFRTCHMPCPSRPFWFDGPNNICAVG